MSTSGCLEILTLFSLAYAIKETLTDKEVVVVGHFVVVEPGGDAVVVPLAHDLIV